MHVHADAPYGVIAITSYLSCFANKKRGERRKRRKKGEEREKIYSQVHGSK